MARRRIPRPQRPDRYRLDPIPGMEEHGAEPRSWSPPTPPDPARQGWLPFADGGQLGPLFIHTDEADR